MVGKINRNGHAGGDGKAARPEASEVYEYLHLKWADIQASTEKSPQDAYDMAVEETAGDYDMSESHVRDLVDRVQGRSQDEDPSLGSALTELQDTMQSRIDDLERRLEKRKERSDLPHPVNSVGVAEIDGKTERFKVRCLGRTIKQVSYEDTRTKAEAKDRADQIADAVETAMRLLLQTPTRT